ncbi:MAG: prepilin-type N-terminal cleavage/methylation domain-containing protein [Candidatus Dojkabacteria bacterium]|nr:prepilin-type N-terminal cleavage/methylation domain-containing protein [Candidatus Dojkabacteria bacterium]
MNINLKGFTLIEIIVVMTIIVFLTASTIAGVFYIQDASLLDNAVREIRSFLLGAQSVAQSKFVVADGDIFANNNGVVIGTYVKIDNQQGASEIRLVRGVIYFTPLRNTFAPEKVASEIQKLFNTTSAISLSCTSRDDFRVNSSTYKIRAVINDLTPYDAKCKESSDLDVFLEKTIKGVRYDSSSSTCGGYIFFSAGYTKILAKDININTNGSCAIKIKTNSILSVVNTINISKDGYIRICGSGC